MKTFDLYIEVWGQREDDLCFRFRKSFILKTNFINFCRFLKMNYESRVIFIKNKFEETLLKVYPDTKWFDLSIINVDLAA